MDRAVTLASQPSGTFRQSGPSLPGPGSRCSGGSGSCHGGTGGDESWPVVGIGTWHGWRWILQPYRPIQIGPKLFFTPHPCQFGRWFPSQAFAPTPQTYRVQPPVQLPDPNGGKTYRVQDPIRLPQQPPMYPPDNGGGGGGGGKGDPYTPTCPRLSTGSRRST